jgi:hypothetical protein
MKKSVSLALLLTPLAMTLSQSASADFVRNYGKCQSLNPKPEQRFSLVLKYVMGTPSPRGAHAGSFSYEAEISESTPSGSMDLDSYRGIQLVESQALGEGFKYVTQDFELQFPVVKPVHGLRVARLHAVSKGRVIEDTLLCHVLR